jgi:hypothetical protein
MPISLRHTSVPETDNPDNPLELSLNIRENWYARRYQSREGRFEKHDDKVVFDHDSGLMWQNVDLPEERKTYDKAQEYCKDLTLAGYENWRLPTVPELISLLEENEREDDLFLDPIFQSPGWYYWSGDIRQIKDDGSAESAWSVYFYRGYVHWTNAEGLGWVRCVRP